MILGARRTEARVAGSAALEVLALHAAHDETSCEARAENECTRALKTIADGSTCGTCGDARDGQGTWPCMAEHWTGMRARVYPALPG